MGKFLKFYLSLTSMQRGVNVGNLALFVLVSSHVDGFGCFCSVLRFMLLRVYKVNAILSVLLTAVKTKDNNMSFLNVHSTFPSLF